MSAAARPVALLSVLALFTGACDGTDPAGGGALDEHPAADGVDGVDAAGGPGAGVSVTMGRATWNTGFMQAAIYQQLLGELGYDVSDPADMEVGADVFYPALARGEADFWANGWFPLHEPFLEGELFGGREISEPISPVGFQIQAGALQGYLIDKKTADELGITSMSDLTSPDIAEVFDADGDGRADLTGCNEGWGCNVAISEHIASLDWGGSVEQVVGSYEELMADVVDRVEQGQPVLFYTWTPNWTVDVLRPGEDVVWLESSPLPNAEGETEVDGLEGCAAEQPCQLGWVANDIRVVANNDFLETNPAAETLFKLVEIPLGDIAEQNAEMNSADSYGEADIARDADEWIEANREQVDQWLQEAMAAG